MLSSTACSGEDQRLLIAYSKDDALASFFFIPSHSVSLRQL